jgi:NADPH:quinone reductase-like Zn-dependent oxidoreductase
MEHNQLRPPIDRVFPVADYLAAFEHLQRGGHFGEVVLTS